MYRHRFRDEYVFMFGKSGYVVVRPIYLTKYAACKWGE